MWLNVAGQQGRTGSKNRPWTLIQTGPPEPVPVYLTTAALLMHPHAVFDVMLVQEFSTKCLCARATYLGLYLSAK